MALDALGIILLVFAILVIVKLLFVVFNPKAWLKFALSLYRNPAVLVVIELVLALLVLYYLLQSLTILQIMGGIVLGALLTGMSFAAYGPETIAWAKKIMSTKSVLKKAWIPALIWLILIIWTLKELF